MTGVEPIPGGQRLRDRLFRSAAYAFAGLVLLLLAGTLVSIGGTAWPAVKKEGVGFLARSAWAGASPGEYGVAPEIWGTLYSSLLALLIGGTLGVAAAVFLSERMLSERLDRLFRSAGLHGVPVVGSLPDRLEAALRNLIDLLAAIPSVVYGLWGIFVLVPLLQGPAGWLHENFARVPFFSSAFGSRGVLPAAIVLAVMILPTVTALSRDALLAVPPKLKEAAYGLGATRWEMIFRVALPSATPGLFAAVALAFGRALGETMALVMLLGNSAEVSLSLFSSQRSLAALLALNYGESGGYKLAALMYAGLTLLAITMTVNVIGTAVMQRAARRPGGR